MIDQWFPKAIYSVFPGLSGRACRRVRFCLLAAIILLSGFGVQAQETQPVSEPEQQAAELGEPLPEPEAESPKPVLLAVEDLPQVTHLAAALADRPSRIQTLLTMIAVERLLEPAATRGVSDADVLQADFRADRAWLDRLAGRYTELPVRGSQLDPAAWFLLRELSQHMETPGLSVSPLGPQDGSLWQQLFDRSNERLAAAILPEVLHRIETQAPMLWLSLVATATANETLLAAISGLNADWFAPWTLVEQPLLAPAAEQPEGAAVIEDVLEQLRIITASTMLPGPPDEFRLKHLRFELFSVFPSLDFDQTRNAAYILELAGAVEGLREERYLAFTESLLWIVSDMLLNEPVVVQAAETPDQTEPDETGPEAAGSEAAGSEETEAADVAVEEVIAPRLPVAGLMAELLPGLSKAYAGEFSAVDPRINANLATVFDAVQYLQGDSRDPDRLLALRQNVGDAITQLVLMIPDLSYYYDQPVRRQIAEEINICTNLAANSDHPRTIVYNREQFDGCIKSLVEMSKVLVNKEELSGDSDGPFGSEQLRRELMMPPWQRINFSLGYLQDQFPTGCRLPEQPLPNPLEWASLANVVTWLARQAPVYFQTPENEARVLGLRQQGLDLLEDIAQQVDCISGQGTGINDPVRISLVSYRQALDDLAAGLREAELEFRAEYMRPGADVVLHGDAFQHTAYRTEGLSIGPCDPDRVCEMAGQLEATRALIGLFPDPYLIADQIGMGKIEICYQNVQWVNRRDVPVRPDDPHVANFFGHLSFDLVGRFRENGAVTEVFGSNFVSPDEYHYLFGEATDEVRDDSCPTEWVGSRIMTSLNSKGAFHIVPDRLTYLAGARKKPSEIIEVNWSKGSEWRDWFVTGLGVTPHEYPPDQSISERVNQHLRSLYQSEQSMIYAALLRPQSRGGSGDAVESLIDLQVELTARKALVRSYMNLFYPDSMIDSDELRASLEGYDSLLDSAVLRRFRESNVAVSSINIAGLARVDRFLSDWNRQPESLRRSGSIASGVAHAVIRLNTLYLEFFVLPSRKTEPRQEALNPAISTD